MRCCTVLQDPATLYWDTPLGLGPFRVVAASYGHPRDPKLAIDVRRQLQTRVGVSDRLDIRREESLTDWLGNPCPGVLKVLRVRYVSLEGVAKGRRREVWLQESEEGHLAEAVSLQVPTKLPLVVVFSAVYGSPGEPSRGRGKMDVTEFMQGRVDLADGKYLFMSRKEPLTDLFGDPCPGRDKCLVIRYEIVGTEGRAEAIESDGRLLTPISISCTPMLAPLILVESATYGQTREGIDERLQLVQRELSDLFAIQNRKDIGMPLSREDNKRLMGLRPLIGDLKYLKKLTPRYVDIRARLQARVEEHGGGLLEFVAAQTDVNQLFGNPMPGKRKELRVRYLVVGHDSERLTSLEETTSSGYPRNFILQRQGQVVVQGGEKLVIDCNTDLQELFDDPCRGVRKKINITYVARGLNGIIRVSEKDRYLVADIVVGYYSRQNFRESKLLAERHGLRKGHRTQESTHQHSRRDERSGSDSGRDSDSTNEPVENTGSLTVANADGLCVPRGDHEDGSLEPPLSLKTSMMMVVGGSGVDPSAVEGRGGGSRTPTMAERRRERRRERRQAHQEDVRRKEAERESERRRMRADKARRDREVARAVREAEDAERLRLLSEAQEAENAAAVPTRLLRTMQRKAVEAIAAVASGAGTTADGRGVVDEPAKAGTTRDRRVPGVNFSKKTVLEEERRDGGGPEQERKGHQPSVLGDGDDSPSKTNMTATRRRSRKAVGHGLPATHANAALADDNEEVTALAGETRHAFATDEPKKGKRKTKSREASEGGRGRTTAAGHRDVERHNKERGALPPPLPGTTAQAGSAAVATAANDALRERSGNKRTSHSRGHSRNAPQGEAEANLTAVSSPPKDVGVGGTTGRPRRKPSEERVGEPRAVFAHRASAILPTDEATGSGEAAGVLVEGARGERNGESHQRRASRKGRVGSVSPSEIVNAA
ncbi:hypothetical protein Esi_0545_0009 [Ectocarpus siliculosus]|uniref:Uncharacterized protein n=1 Tax=Ectocarpus siliculosus TaxID=2880 RepID=D7G442_ECTSI|nr:hypothetical protein Esi_0545_0009 [Ectocarpus siliculosus]|eukprot:CBJ33660.1 hypothetical protein Esi_0545_0009 [Ectocarpus siliculosus]